MIIVVNHKINNPGDFWASAQKSLPELPTAGVQRIIQVLPNNSMNEATCLWEANDIQTLDAYLRSKVHNWSEEQYHEVDTAHAMGFTA
jgi:hypothetical protein